MNVCFFINHANQWSTSPTQASIMYACPTLSSAGLCPIAINKVTYCMHAVIFLYQLLFPLTPSETLIL